MSSSASVTSHIRFRVSHTLLLRHGLPLVLACIVGAVLSMHYGQDQTWDLLNYHYYNAYALLHHRDSMDVAVAGIQTYWNSLFDIVPYLLITHLKPIIAGGILGAFQGVNLFLIYEICLLLLRDRLWGKKLYIVAFLASIVSFGTSVNLGELGTAMGDNTTSALILLSLLIALRTIRAKESGQKRARHWKIIAYTLMGCAVAIKLTNAPFAVALLLLEGFDYRGTRQLIKDSLINAAGLAGGYLIGGGLWCYYLWTNFRSPVFPLYNGIFHSPYYPDQNITVMVSRFFPHNTAEWLFYPFYFIKTQQSIAEVDFRDPRLAILYLLIVLLAALLITKRYSRKFRTLRPSTELQAVLAFMIVSYVLWEIALSNIRYIIPLFLLAAAVIVAIIFTVIPKQKLALCISGVLLIIITLGTTPMSWGRVPWQPTWFGVRLPQDFLQDNSTVLIAGDEPLGFLVPFLPPSDPVIHVESVLSSPSDGDTAMQQLIRSRLNEQARKHSTFYGILTPAGQKEEANAYRAFGFKLSACTPIYTNLSTLEGPVYGHQVCKLIR